jgi:hypothetical protein
MAVLDVGPTDLALDRVTDGSPLSLRIDSPDEDASAWVVTAVVVDRVGGAVLAEFAAAVDAGGVTLALTGVETAALAAGLVDGRAWWGMWIDDVPTLCGAVTVTPALVGGP